MPSHTSSFTPPLNEHRGRPSPPQEAAAWPWVLLGTHAHRRRPWDQRGVGVGSQADAAQHKAGAPDPQGLTLSLPGQEKVQI